MAFDHGPGARPVGWPLFQWDLGVRRQLLERQSVGFHGRLGVPDREVGFAQAVGCVRRPGVLFDGETKDGNRLLRPVAEKQVAERVKGSFFHAIGAQSVNGIVGTLR